MPQIKEFLNKEGRIAVVGASNNPEKWGYRLYKKLKSSGFQVYPVNPKHSIIDKDACYPEIKALPERPDVVITVVKPEITEKIAEECAKLHINKLWMQPGSESEKAIELCRNNGIEVIYNLCFVADKKLVVKNEDSNSGIR
jgi:predicted CoA-binding protein